MTTTTSSLNTTTTTNNTMLTALAHQIEYHFSHCNLRKDVYLQTLRHLNDGCVPLSILCQFQKVKLLTLGVDAKQAVIQAIQARSKHLRVYQIDAKTGRKVNHDADATASSHRSFSSKNEIETLLGVSLCIDM
ncbi:hypothetical protein MPSEU_000823400 [Mayamaea pseudoterrestris]|nr:hypothetical protein MPSEU_000823400 [Mayamaea pseudoterrestris]